MVAISVPKKEVVSQALDKSRVNEQSEKNRRNLHVDLGKESGMAHFNQGELFSPD